MNSELNLTERNEEPVREVSVPLPSEHFKNIRVLLASNSPRRRELLSLILPDFEIAVKKDIDERYPASLPSREVPAFLSKLKADAYKDIITENELIITADTVVISEGRILGKPADTEEAKQMLRELSGREHTVVTGVTLSSLSGRKSVTFTESTDVHFAVLEEWEIEQYVRIFSPLDKAGSYGIQEWIGAAAISRINGCFYNVMGLPLHALYKALKTYFK